MRGGILKRALVEETGKASGEDSGTPQARGAPFARGPEMQPLFTPRQLLKQQQEQQQQQQHQQQQQQQEEGVVPVGGLEKSTDELSPAAGSAPLNFAHFSGAVRRHLSGRTHLKPPGAEPSARGPSWTAMGQPQPLSGAPFPQQRSSASRALGPLGKPAAPMGAGGALGPLGKPAAPMGAGGALGPLGKPAAPMGAGGPPLPGAGPRVHPLGAADQGLVRRARLDGGAQMLGQAAATQVAPWESVAVAGGSQPGAERDATVCPALDGALGQGRAGGSSSASLGGPGSAKGGGSTVPGKGGYSRFGKRALEKETERTASEAVASPSEGARKGSGSKGGGAGDSSTGGVHGPQGGAAKRARAAEVHNLSERRRRDRINEHLRMLQKLIPGSNKTDKASMLDEAIEYLKMLQLQLQVMSMRTGMPLPANLVPTKAACAPVPGPAPRVADAPPREEALSGAGLGATSAGLESLRGLPAAMPGFPHLGPSSALPLAGAAAGVGLADSGLGGSFSAGTLGLREPLGASARGAVSEAPVRQQLVMDRVHADMHDLHRKRQQQHLLQQRQLEQQLLVPQATKAGTGATLGVSAMLRSSRPGLPSVSRGPPDLPTGGPFLEAEMFSGAPRLGPHGQATSKGLPGPYPYAPTLLESKEGGGAVEGTGAPLSIEAMAAAAVILEGHRQLNPSRVDPLDVYLARQQRMQQQQLQRQAEVEQQQQWQQAAVDCQMYQAILRRQNETI